MKQLSEGFKAEVDSDREVWHEILSHFDDANIYQTWDYNNIRSGADNISNIVLTRDQKIVAAAQVRLFAPPMIKIGIAYVYWGPVWHPAGLKSDSIVFSQALRALRNEYVCRRGLALRLFPVLFNDESEKYLSILREEGFQPHEKGKQSRTLLLDLSPSLDELRKGFEQKWRNCLNRAEKSSLELVEGCSDDLFKAFIDIYRQLVIRKKFTEPTDINEFRAMQRAFPDSLKMRILLCRIEGEVIAGAIFSAVGNTGVYIFGATNESGMKSNGSYLLQWKFIEWLKKNGFTSYNLNGINPDRNPGTYKFKVGLCKTHGKDVTFLGQFDAYANALQSMIVGFGESAVTRYRKAKRSMTDWHSDRKAES